MLYVGINDSHLVIKCLILIPLIFFAADFKRSRRIYCLPVIAYHFIFHLTDTGHTLWTTLHCSVSVFGLFAPAIDPKKKPQKKN